MSYNRPCRGTKNIPYPDYCGLPLYEPWPNSSRFFFNGAYWYPTIENMSNDGKMESGTGTIFVIATLVILFVVLLIILNKN